MALTELKEHIETSLHKLESDPKLLEHFKADPVKTLEGILGVDLPDEHMKEIVEGIKLKLGADHLGDMVKGLGGLFGKK